VGTASSGLGFASQANVAELKPLYAIEGVTYRSAEYARTQLNLGNWLNISIGDSLRRTARATPDKIAVIDPDGSLRFAELDARSESVAASLLDLGLRPGDRALFQVGTSKEYFTAFFGCMKAGVVTVCTLPQYRLSEMRHFGDITSAKAIFVQADVNPRFDQTAFALELEAALPKLRHVIVVRGEHAKASSLERMATAFSADQARARTAAIAPGILDLAAFQLSGGSTSLPKIIPRMHGEYLGATRQLSERYGLTSDDVTLWSLPLIQCRNPICRSTRITGRTDLSRPAAR
jgi:non-ribosomal peptide synthetase component E (peptide arylation enzyme)